MLNRVIDDLERGLAVDAEILDRKGITHWLMQFSANLPIDLEHPRIGKISYRGVKFAGSVVPTFDRYVVLSVDDLVEKHVRNTEAAMESLSFDQLDETARLAADLILRRRSSLFDRAGVIKAQLLGAAGQPQTNLISRQGVNLMDPRARLVARAAELKVRGARSYGTGAYGQGPYGGGEAQVSEPVGSQGVEVRAEPPARGVSVLVSDEAHATDSTDAIPISALWNATGVGSRLQEIIDATEKNLEVLRNAAIEWDRQVRAHNNPPALVDEAPLDTQDLQVALAAIPVLRRLLQQREPDRDVVVLVHQALESAQRVANNVLSWLARFGNDIFEAAKTTFGKVIGGGLAVGALWEAARLLNIDLPTIRDVIEAALKLM